MLLIREIFRLTIGLHQDPQNGQVLGIGCKVDRLFEADTLKLPLQSDNHHIVAAILPQEIWHSRLGHLCDSRLDSLISSGVLGKVKRNNADCILCQLAKHHALPFNNSTSISTAPFDPVHSDVWGPSLNSTMGGC